MTSVDECIEFGRKFSSKIQITFVNFSLSFKYNYEYDDWRKWTDA